MGIEDFDRIHIGQGMTIMSQYKPDYGVGIYWGPTLRECYAIFVEIDGKFQPYKFYKNVSTKTLKRARQHLKYYRAHYPNAFKLDVIWETVPLEEMNYTWYENTEKAIEEIEARMGQPRGRIVVGHGRDDGGVLDAGTLNKKTFEQILACHIEEASTIRLDTEPAGFDGGPSVGEEGSSGRQGLDDNAGRGLEVPEHERHDSGGNSL